MAIPTLIGNPLQEVTAKQLVGKNIYVLGTTNPQSPTRTLYAINKENLFAGAFQDLDIDENIFNNPNFETSYQDMVGHQFTGLPDLTRICAGDYMDPWLVEFKRNPVLTENIQGVQIVSTLTGIRFMRYGKDGVFSAWQLDTGNVIGALQHMIVSDTVSGLNYMGWLPLNGATHSKDHYPKLYEILKNKVTTTDTTFTLPDGRGYYLGAAENGKAGTSAVWTMPNITDTVDLVKGLSKSLFKSMTEDKKLFKVSIKDNSTSTMSYLDDAVIKDTQTGDANPTEGLTNELKLDLENKIGKEHVGDKVMPNTIYSSNIYIYAGYPQGYSTGTNANN